MIKWAFGWVLHRRPREERQMWIDLGAATQEDELRKEELKAMAQTLGKSIYVEGYEDGLRKTLMAQGRKCFGEPSPDVLLTLNAIEDLDRLDRMSLRLLDASSWTELIETE